MNNFTVILKESGKNYEYEALSNSDISNFLSKVNKTIPTIVKDVIHLTNKYNLLDKTSIENIRLSSKSSLKKLSKLYNIREEELEDFWKLLKALKNNINLLPQYMSQQERDMMMKGQLNMEDLTIDLETPQGRNIAAKQYMPVIYSYQ